MGAHPLKSATVAVVSAVATVGVAIAVLASGGGAGKGPHHATAPQLNPATGTIAFSRNTGEGTFEDSGGPTFQLAPGTDAIIGQTDAQNTCCLSPSAGVARFALAVAGTGPPHVLAIGRHVTEPIRTPNVPATLVLTPGAWSRDGTLLAYAGIDRAHPARNGVYEAAKGSGHLVRLTAATPGRPQRPLAYSPDNHSLLVFERNPSGRFGALLLTRRGREPRVVGPPVTCCFFGSPASWSPDGRSFAFAAFSMDPDTPGESAVFVDPADGSYAHRITPWGRWTTSARWSPSGDWIVFDRDDGSGFHNEYLVHPDGSGLHVIDTDPQARGACCAQWSPDGRYLAYQHVENADEQHVALYVVNVNGPPHRRRTTSADGSYMSFGWVP